MRDSLNCIEAYWSWTRWLVLTDQKASISFFKSSTCRREEYYFSFLIGWKVSPKRIALNFGSTSKICLVFLFLCFLRKLYICLSISLPLYCWKKKEGGGFRRNNMVGYSQVDERATPLESNVWSHFFPYFPCLHLTNLGGTCTDQNRGSEKIIWNSAQDCLLLFKLLMLKIRTLCGKENVHIIQSIHIN